MQLLHGPLRDFEAVDVVDRRRDAGVDLSLTTGRTVTATLLTSPRSPPALDPGDDLGPEADQEDDRDHGDDRDPAAAGGLAEEEVAAEGDGHRPRW